MSYYNMYMWAMSIISAPFVLVFMSYIFYLIAKTPPALSIDAPIGVWFLSTFFAIICLIISSFVIWFAGIIIPMSIPICLLILTYFIWDNLSSWEQMKNFFNKK